MAWFHDFFDEEYVEILRAKRSKNATRAEVAFICKHLELQRGCTVLDAPSGFGRHAVEFAKRGCHVTAVDLSKAMLAARKRHTRVSYLRMDLRAIPFREEFDGIFSSSSGYFSNSENQRLLQRFSDALKPGGRLMLWTFSTKERGLHPKGRSWSKHGNRYILSEHRYDPRTGVFQARWHIWRAGLRKPIVKNVRVRGYALSVWKDMLKQAGLRLVSTLPKPVSDGDGGGVALIAEKPGGA